MQAQPTSAEAVQPPALSDLRPVSPGEKAYDRVHRRGGGLGCRAGKGGDGTGVEEEMHRHASGVWWPPTAADSTFACPHPQAGLYGAGHYTGLSSHTPQLQNKYTTLMSHN